jgi:hypothetical protein
MNRELQPQHLAQTAEQNIAIGAEHIEWQQEVRTFWNASVYPPKQSTARALRPRSWKRRRSASKTATGSAPASIATSTHLPRYRLRSRLISRMRLPVSPGRISVQTGCRLAPKPSQSLFSLKPSRDIFGGSVGLSWHGLLVSPGATAVAGTRAVHVANPSVAQQYLDENAFSP